MKEKNKNDNLDRLYEREESVYLRLKYEDDLSKHHKNDYDLGYDQGVMDKQQSKYSFHHYPEKLPSLSKAAKLIKNNPAFNSFMQGYQMGLNFEKYS